MCNVLASALIGEEMWNESQSGPEWLLIAFCCWCKKKKKFPIVPKTQVLKIFIIKTGSGWSSRLLGRRSRSCCVGRRQGENSSRRLVSSFWEAKATFSFISAESLLSCGDLHSSLMLQWLLHRHTSNFNAEVWFPRTADLYENTCKG